MMMKYLITLHQSLGERGGGRREQGTHTHPTDNRGRPLPFLGAETRPETLENLKRTTGRRTRREGGYGKHKMGPSWSVEESDPSESDSRLSRRGNPDRSPDRSLASKSLNGASMRYALSAAPGERLFRTPSRVRSRTTTT